MTPRFLVLPFLAGLACGSAVAEEAAPVRVVLFGDSLISSYGVDPKVNFGAELELALKAKGRQVQVVDTGFTSTSLAGVARVENLLATDGVLGGTDLKAVILELGSNDCFRRTLAETQTNLDRILATLTQRRIPVLVAGTTPYKTCERKDRPNYTALYEQMFADLATKYGDLYYRDFKAGLEDQPGLLQSDHDHPTAEGDAVVVAGILKDVLELVDRAGSP